MKKKKKGILDNKQWNLAKFQNFEKYRSAAICIDVPGSLHNIWELLSSTLFACTFDFVYFFQFLQLSSSFFHFLPEGTGRNTFFSSFFHSFRKKPISSGSFRTLSDLFQKNKNKTKKLGAYIPFLY